MVLLNAVTITASQMCAFPTEIILINVCIRVYLPGKQLKPLKFVEAIKIAKAAPAQASV